MLLKTSLWGKHHYSCFTDCCGHGELAVLCYMRVTSQLMNASKPVIWTQPSVLRVSAVTRLMDKPGSTHTEMWITTRNYTSDMDKDYLHCKRTSYKILCVLWFHFSFKGKCVFELGKRLKSVHPEMLTVTFFGRWDDGYVSLLLSSCLAHSFGSQTAGQNHTPTSPLQPRIPLRSQPGLTLPSKPHGSLPIHLPLSTVTTCQH